MPGSGLCRVNGDRRFETRFDSDCDSFHFLPTSGIVHNSVPEVHKPLRNSSNESLARKRRCLLLLGVVFARAFSLRARSASM